MVRFPRVVPALIAVVLCATACGGRDKAEDRAERPDAAENARNAPLPVAGATGPRVVILGDSLTAGLGLPPASAFPTRLQRRLEEEGLKYTVVNAGVSGDTSAGGLSRLEWALDGDVRVLVVALGGNDGLRGLPVEGLTQNLSRIVERAQAKGVAVLLAGMEAPPNYGVDYTLAFHKVYPAVAKKYHVALLPFLLERVAGVSELNQADGIHPTADGAQMVADNVWAVLKPLVEEDARRGNSQRVSSP